MLSQDLDVFDAVHQGEAIDRKIDRYRSVSHDPVHRAAAVRWEERHLNEAQAPTSCDLMRTGHGGPEDETPRERGCLPLGATLTLAPALDASKL